MSRQPLVSTIIAVHNGAEFLEETIQSALNQTYPWFEVITVDDGSTDSSRDILQAHGDVTYISQKNLGNAHARNTGIQRAQGEIVAFLDQDDLWHPDKLLKQVDALLSDPSIMFTVSHFKSFLSPGSEMPRWCRRETFDVPKPDFSPSSLVARKEAFIRNGLFKEDFKIASDVGWFFEANDNRIPWEIVPEVLHMRRVHNNNQSNSVQHLHKEMLSLIRQSVKRKKSSLSS